MYYERFKSKSSDVQDAVIEVRNNLARLALIELEMKAKDRRGNGALNVADFFSKKEYGGIEGVKVSRRNNKEESKPFIIKHD